MSAAAPSRRFSTTIFRVLALAVVCFSGAASAETINANDCAALLSWKPYAKFAGVSSCSSQTNCGDLPGIECSDGGRVSYVDLSSNNLSGTLPSEWSTMTALANLFLYSNNLSGTLPSEWSTMTALTRLWLSYNNLSGTLPSEWSNMTAMNSLDLSSNNLSGTLPSEWSTMTALTRLYLFSNNLSGTLPSEWSTMTALTWLWLSYNNLSGTLPSEWSTMTALTYLDLSSNNLSGTLPSEWSTMTYLTGLALSSNNLSGTLPSEWSTMTALTGLYLYSNNLSGTLPSEWSTMTALTYFNATGTKLCGPDPFPRIDTQLPTCPTPMASPPRRARASPKPRGLSSPHRPPSPPSVPTPKNVRCGVVNKRRNRCPGKGCCSRWGWCGTSGVHCDATKGCQKAYGICPLASKPPPVYELDTDPADCGPAKRRRCRTGYCCSARGTCSSLAADCSLVKRCKIGYGLCYDSKDDLQYSIDIQLKKAGPAARNYASTPTSNATRLSLYSFSLGSRTKVCDALRSPCKPHTVTSEQTLEEIASLYGTTTWQILLDNPLLSDAGPTGMVPLRPYDVLAVRPSPRAERLRWQWTRTALLLGSSSYPRPCSGYSSETDKKLCFCHYHPGTGTYVWPFSTGANKCREAIECKNRLPTLVTCSASLVADDTEFNGQTQCLKQPSGFECSTGDGCTSVHCFCKEFLLKPGTYQNPFDSTRTTGIVCNWSNEGWYGGMVQCEGGYFDPYTRDCTTKPQPNIPYRRGYTSCDGVPDPDMEPLAAKSGRRLQAVTKPTRHVYPTCNKDSCCKKGLAAGKKYRCIPCAKGSCKPGNVFTNVVSRRSKKCHCQIWGSCPTWFNKNCKFLKPGGRTKKN